ncbi:MAG TPA: response regulator [Kiritimatiellia bacterium]|jgi:CheY-like chemotaxis protein
MKKKILMIDDDPLLLTAVKRVLEDTGRFEVRAKQHPARAVDAVLSFKPDLVILDVIMPHIDGGTIANQLLDDPRTKSVPVLFLTSTVTEEKVKDFGGRIANRPFVAKPVDIQTLLQRIDGCLGAP